MKRIWIVSVLLVALAMTANLPAVSAEPVWPQSAIATATATRGSSVQLTPTSPAPQPSGPPTTAPPPSNPGDTKNCTDFATYAEAKAWFDLYFPYYGDIAKLDADQDGIPCETLPGAP